jgi:hypothetical protein
MANFFTVPGIPGYQSLHKALAGPQLSFDHRIIFFVNPLFLKLGDQMLADFRSFGGDDHPGGFLIQSVNNARPAAVLGESLFETPAVMKEALDKCAGMVAAPRMYHDSLGFVQNDDILVFIEDIQVHRLRGKVRLRKFTVANLESFSPPDLMRGLHKLRIDADLGFPGLPLTSGKETGFFTKVFVQAQPFETLLRN